MLLLELPNPDIDLLPSSLFRADEGSGQGSFTVRIVQCCSWSSCFVCLCTWCTFNVVVTNQKDVQHLQDVLSFYARVLSTNVIWAKSEALLVGLWKEQVVPSPHPGLESGKEGLKILGNFLATEGFQTKKWEEVLVKGCAQLCKLKS